MWQGYLNDKGVAAMEMHHLIQYILTLAAIFSSVYITGNWLIHFAPTLPKSMISQYMFTKL